MSYSQMIIEDNDLPMRPYHGVIWDDTNANVLWPKIPSMPWPPQVEIDQGHNTASYVLPVLGIVLGGAVLALALGYWAIQKLRLW